MGEKRIQSILQNALEDEIPSMEVQLWPRIRANLVADKRKSLQQGEKMNTIQVRRIPRLAIAIIAIVTLLAVALITPRGRSFAQSVLALFTRAESTSFPLQPSQIWTGEPEAAVPTALPPAPLISVAEAEEQLGFEVAQLPSVPDGFNYLGARIYGDAVNIEYETPDRGGHLSIQQSLEGFYQTDWDQVPAEVIIPVKIGKLDGEFVQGTFVVYPGETSATWNPDIAMLRLRWKQDGVWFEITKYGNVEAIEYLDQAGIIKLAESLTVTP
jgi:hypothetical protein